MLKKIENHEMPLYMKNYYEPQWTDSGSFRPLRFSSRQMALYGDEPGRKIRSLCTAGVSIGMITDSDMLKVTFEVMDHARDFAWFDLFVDGVFTATVGSEPTVPGINQLTFNLNEKAKSLKQVEIYLPHTVDIIIHHLEYEDGSSIEPLPKKKLILATGDSITQGMTAKCPSSSYPVLISRMLDMDLLNYGVGGYVFDENSIDPDKNLSPSLITVSYGVNDWAKYESREYIKDRCSGFFSKLNSTYPHVPVFVITPLWCSVENEERSSGYLWQIRETIALVAGKYENNVVFDGHKMVPNMPEYFADGVHPNDKGFIHFGINLLAGIIKHIKGGIF